MNSKMSPKVTLATQQIPGFSERIAQLKKWMQVHELSDNTFKNYARCIAELSLYYKLLPENLRQEQFTDYFSVRINSAHSPSLSEFKQTVYGMRCYFKMLNVNTTIKLPALKKTDRLPSVLSKHECNVLFQAATGVQKLVLMMIYSAGLRVCELIRLEWGDIDPIRMTIFIRRSKGQKDRYVPLSKAMLKDLLFLIKGKRGPFIFSPKNKITPLRTNSVRKMMRQAVKQSGLVKHRICLHTLRHSYATHLLEDGLDIIAIKELLGHSRLESTLVYLHVANVAKHRKGSPLDKLLSVPKGDELTQLKNDFFTATVRKSLNEKIDSGNQIELWNAEDV